MFMRTEKNDIADVDREGIQQFLNKKRYISKNNHIAVVWINSAEELSMTLSQDFEDFRNDEEKVLG